MMILIRRVRRTKKYKQGNNIRKTEEKQYERKREKKMRREKASYEIYANHNLLFLFKDIISLWESPLCMCLVKTKEASSKVSSWRESVCGRSRKGEGLLVRFHHEGIYEWNVVRIYFGVCIMSKEIVMRFLSWGNIYVKYSEDLSWGFIMSNCFFLRFHHHEDV